MATTAAAECFKGSNKRPDHGVNWMEQALVAAQNCEKRGVFPDKAEIWTSTKGKMAGTCMSFGLKNLSGGFKSVTTEQVLDAFMREYIGCEHGGKRKYEDGLEYV
ncbi:hypothetical protein B0H66DRAFT_477942 [Apodospora peruviana]|uniref:Uncharacterized protein n=1 Tax=Apodospora peruviana TaxID=516989 RepID=A0AAE0I3X4_9PEZI|nr:hypothetical protein B0H66DRAFT_477942 [Apodospora peruviana]